MFFTMRLEKISPFPVAENSNLRDMAKQLLEVVITEYYMIPWKRGESGFCILLLNFPFKGNLFYLRYFISRTV